MLDTLLTPYFIIKHVILIIFLVVIFDYRRGLLRIYLHRQRINIIWIYGKTVNGLYEEKRK